MMFDYIKFISFSVKTSLIILVMPVIIIVFLLLLKVFTFGKAVKFQTKSLRRKNKTATDLTSITSERSPEAYSVLTFALHTLPSLYLLSRFFRTYFHVRYPNLFRNECWLSNNAIMLIIPGIHVFTLKYRIDS